MIYSTRLATRVDKGKVWGYVFITSKQPRKIFQAVRRLKRVSRADALFGTPDVIAIVEGRNVASMDAVIDRTAETPLVLGTGSKVARWIK